MGAAAELSLVQAALLLQRRALSPVDYVAAFLDRIARHDSHLNAFLQVFSDSALADARTAEAEINKGDWRGPLDGVPIALKDLFDVAGMPTTAHSKIRPFRSVEEMDEAMIASWNAVVGPDDDVWHLGDFAYRIKPGRLTWIFARLQGRKMPPIVLR